MKWLYAPFILQGFIMVLDEFYFHERRGLPRWERWGHPLDSLSVALTLGVLIWGNSETLFKTLGLFSCLFITKDEFIHKEKCSGPEQWLHSLLFILHPLTFLAAYLLWKEGEFSGIKLQFFLILTFMFYQIFRWSFRWQTLK